MKNLIIILAIAFVAISSNLFAQQEIVWKSHYLSMIDPNKQIDPGRIYNAIFTPDDKFIIVSCSTRTFVLEAQTGKYVKDLKGVNGVIRFSNDGRFIYTYDNKKINYETGEVIGEFLNKGEKIPRFTSMDVCENAGIMIGVLQNADYINWRKDIWVFDLKTMNLKEQLGDTNEYYEQITISPEGSYFNTKSFYQKKDVRIQHNYFWDAKLLKQIFNGFDKQLYTVKYSSNGKIIGSVKGGNIKIFDTQTIKSKLDMNQSNQGSLTGIDFTANSNFLGTCGYGSIDEINDIHIWDISSGELAYRYSNYSKEIVSQDFITFSHDGRNLIGWAGAGIIYYNAYYSTTKVDPIIYNDTLQVFPNPSNKKINIDIINITNISFRIFNEIGQEFSVISNLGNSKLEIDISTLEKGVYYLVLTQNDVSKLYKFIKE